MDSWRRGRLCAGSRAAGTAPRENLKNTPGEEATEDDQLAVLAAMEETRRESVGRFDWCPFPDWDEFAVSRALNDPPVRRLQSPFDLAVQSIREIGQKGRDDSVAISAPVLDAEASCDPPDQFIPPGDARASEEPPKAALHAS